MQITRNYLRIGNVVWLEVSFNNSDMNREVHVSLCERLTGRFRRPTRLFMGNEDSGGVHALFYSLILSCILNKLNPRLYIHYIITKIHDLRQGKVEAKALLPHTIDRDVLQVFAQAEIEKAKKIFNSS